MKITSYLCLLLIFTEMFIYGCKKKTSAIPLGMSCKIDNVTWSNQNCRASIIGQPYYYTSTLRIIGSVGAWNNATVVTILLFNYPNTIGTYKIAGGAAVAAAEYADNAAGTTVYATSGILTINKVSSLSVEGTFNFIADSISVTDGQFNIPF
jgi:hypothetical protein